MRFVVADNGVGIDDPMRERLFQPFVQADMSTTRRFGGTGLGLAICERLVHLMGGAIELSGASGQGTRLVVTLPLPLATEAAPDAAALPLAPRWPITAPKAARLLVAEDDRVNQKVVKHQLRALGYEADIADDGQAALQRWREGQYAMLLTDLFMPHLDGYELAAAIRREEAADAARGRLPIVMLTANAQADTGQRARAAGIDSVLTKPADLGLLRDTLQRWLRATPPAASSTAVLRLELLHELVGEHPLAVREVLRNFVPTAREMGAELRLALASGDVVHAGALAHKLTSASRAVGAVALGEFCARLQGQGDASDVVPAAISLRAFEQVLRQTLAAVEGHLSEAQP